MHDTEWFALTLLPNSALAIKNALTIPDIEKATKRVNDDANCYTAIINYVAHAMQFTREREKQDEELLEWICPIGGSYITPKRRDDVEDTCQRFLNSKEYLSWVGQGPSMLICSGQRIFLYRTFSDFHEAGAGKSHLV